MSVDNRAFVAKYSRLLRKKLASKLIVDFLARRSVALFPATRRLFHLYLQTASPDEVPHRRLDPGGLITASTPIDARMEAHLRSFERYGRGVGDRVQPGRLEISIDLKLYELQDCDLLPWLGLTVHRPSGLVLDGGLDAQPRLVSRKRPVPGLVISLVDTPRGHNHYFHFFERLTLVMRALKWVGPETPLTLLVRDSLSSYQKAAIGALAARRPGLRVQAVANYEIVQPERLLLLRRAPCPMICWFTLAEEWAEIGRMIREDYGPPPPGPTDRRLHLSRRQQKLRRVVNEDALEPVFAKHSFELVLPDTLSHMQQVHLITQARVIAAAEGAAMTSLMFAERPVRMIMMAARDTINPFWEALALFLGHEFIYVEGGHAQWYDAFKVEPAALDAALSEPLPEAEPQRRLGAAAI